MAKKRTQRQKINKKIIPSLKGIQKKEKYVKILDFLLENQDKNKCEEVKKWKI